jgi:DNA-binding NarL/FixJ family response regulator
VILLAKGYAHKQIAAALNLSASNVEKTLKLLRKKLNVKNNLEMIAHLTSQGII